eukprot:5714072-Pyramimonas_sp.AAC.1
MTTTSQIEGGWFSNCGSRLSAAHIRLIKLQELRGSRAGRFEIVALASAPCTVVGKKQKLHGLRAVPFQNVALAIAPRTLCLHICKNVANSHDQRTKN